jgi:hypothetical protein
MGHGDLHPTPLSRPCIAEVMAVTHANLRALLHRLIQGDA